jgi:hypothetical protein
MSGRPYTEQEDAFLHENYKRRGARWCADRLPGRTKQAIYSRARQLKLSRDVQPIRRQSNDFIDAIIRRYYTGERPPGFVNTCSRQVGRDRSWVSHRAWTQAELEYVSGRPLVSLHNLSKRMARKGWRRTPGAIAEIRKTGLVETTDPAQFSAAGLAAAMGVTTKAVTNWIDRGLLKATRRGWEITSPIKGDGYTIHERDVAAFVIRYPAHVSLAKMEPNKFWFLDLLSRHAKSFPSMIRHGEAA